MVCFLYFAISILAKETPLEFIGHFGFKSGREVDKFKSINYKPGITGVPIILDNSTGYLEAEVIGSVASTLTCRNKYSGFLLSQE
ncbi:MAG: flavin reductase [Candidatus Desantisbacteria bacterium]